MPNPFLPAKRPKRKLPTLVPTGFVSSEGRPILFNSDGGFSSELSITVNDPRLNGGKWTNIPSIWDGKQLTSDAAVTQALKTKKAFVSFGTLDEAVKAAGARSKSLDDKPVFAPGEAVHGRPGRTMQQAFPRGFPRERIIPR